MYGLQGQGPSAGVEAVLLAMAEKIRSCNGELNGQAVGNALYGLQGLSDSPGVKVVWLALLPLLASSQLKTHACIAQAWYGCYHLRLFAELSPLLLAQLDQLPTDPMLLAYGNICSLVQSMHLSGHADKIPASMQVALRTLAARESDGARSRFEKDAQITLEGLPAAQWQSNVLVDGFELDVFLPSLRLNVELDGGHHMGVTQKRRDQRRDRYLRTVHSISVVRIGWQDWRAHQWRRGKAKFLQSILEYHTSSAEVAEKEDGIMAHGDAVADQQSLVQGKTSDDIAKKANLKLACGDTKHDSEPLLAALEDIDRNAHEAARKKEEATAQKAAASAIKAADAAESEMALKPADMWLRPTLEWCVINELNVDRKTAKAAGLIP